MAKTDSLESSPRTTRSQGLTRRSRRLRGQNAPEPSIVPRKPKTNGATRPKQVRRSVTRRSHPSVADPDETETDEDDATVSSVEKTEPPVAQANASAPREESAVLSKMVDLLARMETTTQEMEAARVRERVGNDATHRQERQEMQHLVREAIDASTRQTQMVTAAFRDAIQAATGQRPRAAIHERGSRSLDTGRGAEEV